MTKLKRNSNKARDQRKRTLNRVKSHRHREKEIQSKLLNSALKCINGVDEWETIAIEEMFKIGSFEARRDLLQFYIDSPEHVVNLDLNDKNEIVGISICRLVVRVPNIVSSITKIN